MSNRRYVFDIETDGIQEEATKIHFGVLIDIDTNKEYVFNEHQMDGFKDMLLNANELIGHNIIMFDIPICNKLLGININCKLEDTLVVSRMMYPDRFDPLNPLRAGHGLEEWGKYLGEHKIDFKQVVAKKAITRMEETNFLPDKEQKQLVKEINQWAKKKSAAAFKGPPPGGFVSTEEWLKDMEIYCVQDVRTNCAVYKKQTSWISNNKKPLQLEYLATKFGARQVMNGWGYNRGGGLVVEEELIDLIAKNLEDLQQTFPTIVNRRFSTKQKNPDGSFKELKPEVVEFNPGSSNQVYQRLKEKYPFFNPGETEGGNPSCSSESLLEYANRIPEVRAILQYRDAEKLLTQVSDYNKRSKESNTIHGSINIQGAVTGRCTHSNPNIGQVAKDPKLRSLFIPCVNHNNYVVLGSDLEGLELRVLAHYMHPWDNGSYGNIILSGDKTQGTDIHTVNQKAAGLSTRDQAKTFIYGLIYGAGDKKLGKIVNPAVTNERRLGKEGRELREKFYNNLPALSKLVEEVKSEVARYKTVTLPDTRRVPIRSEHASLNTLLQGAGAIISKYWMILANRNLDAKFGVNAVKQMAYVHDELQFCCPKDIAEEAGKVITDSAIEAGERLSIKIPIEADYAIGKSWAETH